MGENLLRRAFGPALVLLGTIGEVGAASAAAGDAGARALTALVREHSELTTTVRVESAINTRDAGFQRQEVEFEPKLELELPFDMSFTAIARVRYDAFERLEPGDPAQPEISVLSRRGHIGDHTDVDLRELYVDAVLGSAFLRVGKQQIVWGKADGLKVLDVVNPQDFREFVLDDFEHSRIPLWSVNAEVPIWDVMAQLVWLPDPTFHDIPEQDSVYALTSTRLVPPEPEPPFDDLITVNLREPDRPRQLFKDSDIGLRLSAFWGGFDLTLNYLYHYSDTPVLEQRLAGTLITGLSVDVTPRYERTHLVGATFSNAWGDLTVRGEIGYTTDRWLTTELIPQIIEEGATADGTFKTSELAYVLGFDWYGFSNTLLSLQVFQSVLMDHERFLLRDKADENVSFLVRRTFRNETLTGDVIVVHNLTDHDGFVRPKLSYDLNDETKIWLGFDVFYGDDEGVFGQFDDLDRFLAGLEWSR